MRLLTRQSWLKTGLPPAAVNLLAKVDSHQARPADNPLECHVWGVMLEHYKTFYPKPENTDVLKKVLQLRGRVNTARAVLDKKTEYVTLR